MKKLVLKIEIDTETNLFVFDDKFKELPLGEQISVIGMISSMLHNYQHIHAEKQNEYVLKKVN